MSQLQLPALRLPAGAGEGERGHQPWGLNLDGSTSSNSNIRENLQGLVPFQPSRALTALIIIVVVVIVTKHSYTAIKYKLDNTRSWPEELRLQTGWTANWIPQDGWGKHSLSLQRLSPLSSFPVGLSTVEGREAEQEL